jgi:PPOX class probable F420-dependent enzyme
VVEPTPEAPRMPRLYGVPTDASGADLLPWSWAVEQLTLARNYWVCTTRSDGRPHTAPVWGLWLDDAVWFSTAPSSVKGRNLARDPRVVIHLESGDDTVILEGEAERPSDDRALERFIDLYEEKYGYRIESPRAEHSVFVFKPRVAQTWTEPDFPRNATRWVFG